jgi:maltose-binding protein MalE
MVDGPWSIARYANTQVQRNILWTMDHRLWTFS